MAVDDSSADRAFVSCFPKTKSQARADLDLKKKA
jgi:hypothetical protein